MSKLMNDIKDEFDDILSDKRTKDINKDNVVTKLMNENNSKYHVDLSKEFPEIPLDYISFRPENEYSIQAINALADSIWEVGLLQPIIVYVGSEEEGKHYTLSDGERRFRALKVCKDRAVKENNKEKIEQFSLVKCKVLTKEQLKEEERIHHDANKARINTIFEIIARYKPQQPSVYFGDSDNNKNRKAYIERKYGEGGWNRYKNDEIKVKWNNNTLYDDIFLKFNEDYPQYQIQQGTVERYVRTILSLSAKSIKAVNNENYKLDWKKVVELSKLTNEEQDEVITKVIGGQSYDNAIAAYRKESVKVKAEEDGDDKEISDDKYIVKLGKKFIDESNKATERIDAIKNKGFNGNQKEYLKQLKKIQKEIKKLSEMPQK